MIILGINDIAHHNTSAAIVKDGEIVAAIEEERISRIKLDNGYPYAAINEVLEIAGLSAGDIDHVALAGLDHVQQRPALNLMFDHIAELAKEDDEIRRFYRKQQLDRYSRLLRSRPKLPKAFKDKVSTIVEHHQAHAASAYFASPFEGKKVGVISLDGSGDFSWGSVWVGENGKMEHVEHLHALNSLALLYSAFTIFLGFKATRHEGKVLGLAAFGKPEPLYSRLMDLVNPDDWDHLLHPRLAKCTLRQHGDMAQNSIRELTEGLCKEDIAAGLQAFTEKLVCDKVESYAKELDVRYLALAGGIFANVKLNQRILELPAIDNIYIHPNMGDGGLAAGAALQAYANLNPERMPMFMNNVYLGTRITRESAEAALVESGLGFEAPENMAKAAAGLLADGKVVARACDGMEYGPRALGNRTVMAACSDPTINDWLNKKFQRTEFMPFAPVILEEHCAEYFPAWVPDHKAARFMTLTYDAADVAKEKIPAAVHVDQTARPQVIRREDNRDYYDILHEFHALTGVASVINTSFNMHEEPIVCTASDAIRAFLDAKLDALILGPFLVFQPE
ncbi:carbamoyltransferase [Mariprofundus ferrinatatus]|uniref:Carbamoyltransferase n=1 Tax=Mariprofundus ferrinatatus TaxID=1921087 RepID=A0A2K8L718_9PROT|nr:carbamoyltransferase N-terminal domain-containing protein [Mariprofundus ferrinatatus]ATX82049.1 carbamoyltransferase [Mariprofundus ferrinatatus]